MNQDTLYASRLAYT